MVMNFKGNPDAPKMGREFLTTLRKDRTDFFLTDFIRSFMWVLIAATVIALYLKKEDLCFGHAGCNHPVFSR